MIFHRFASWFALLISSAYDDIMTANYISNKAVIALHFNTTIPSLYHGGTFYSAGFLLGAVVWNILIQYFSNRRLLNIVQPLLLLSTALIFSIRGIIALFILNFVQGFLISAILLLVYSLIRYNFSEARFNHFIAMNGSLVYLAEAMIPMINLYLNHSPTLYIVGILLIVLVTQYTAFIPLKDPPRLPDLKSSFLYFYTHLFQILCSNFSLLFCVCSICEGLNDTLLNLVEGILGNLGVDSTITYYFLCSISILSSLSVYLGSLFISRRIEKSGNLPFVSKLKSAKKLLKLIALSLFTAAIIPTPNSYWVFLLYISIFLIGSALVHYLCLYAIHIKYKDSAIVVSILLVLETIASIFFRITCLPIQNSRRGLMVYILFFTIIMSFLVNYLMNEASNSRVKRLPL